MAEDLQEIYERIVFAESQIGQLDIEIRKFCDANMTILTRSMGQFALRNPAEALNTIDVIAKQSVEVNTTVRSLTGTIIHELRSCLDSLACTLAVRNEKSTSGTYFPISKTKEVFESDGLSKLKKLNQFDQEKIVSLRPYREENRILFGLHEADRIHKHVRLTGFSGCLNQAFLGQNDIAMGGQGVLELVRTTISGVYVERMTLWTGRPIDVGGVNTIIAQGVPKSLPLQIVTSVAFAEPDDLANLEVITTLRNFVKAVTEIVDRFV